MLALAGSISTQIVWSVKLGVKSVEPSALVSQVNISPHICVSTGHDERSMGKNDDDLPMGG